MKTTSIGTPVQFFKAFRRRGNPDWCWDCHPAVISNVNQAIVDIRVFPKEPGPSQHFKNVRHADFRVEGEDFWDFIHQTITPDGRNAYPSKSQVT